MFNEMRRTCILASALATVACSQAPSPVMQCLTDAPQYISIPSGEFLLAAQPMYAEEGPSRRVTVNEFAIQNTEVTNAQFAEFVTQTGYVTDAERARANPAEEGSAVFAEHADALGINAQWALVKGATWRKPLGVEHTDEAIPSHPVVHVSLRDARAYAKWAGGRLPTELEWEYAASLGLPDATRPDSGAYDTQGQAVANTWQGVFPIIDAGHDGFKGTAPVGCFAPSTVGLYDMIGNVWEWTDTPSSQSTHLIKGGSFLCANNFCKRYRPAARQSQDIDFSTNHIGFRLIQDPAH